MTPIRIPFIKLTSIPPGATVEEIEAILAASHEETIAEWQVLNASPELEPSNNAELRQALDDLQ